MFSFFCKKSRLRASGREPLKSQGDPTHDESNASKGGNHSQLLDLRQHERLQVFLLVTCSQEEIGGGILNWYVHRGIPRRELFRKVTTNRLGAIPAAPMPQQSLKIISAHN